MGIHRDIARARGDVLQARKQLRRDIEQANREHYRTPQGRGVVIDCCTAAALIQAGVDPTPVLGQKAVDEADRIFGREYGRGGGATLLELANYGLDVEGLPREKNSYATIEAWGSTATADGLLQHTVESSAMASFMARDTTTGWTSMREVANFKQQSRARIEQPERLEQLPRGQEASHFSLNVTSAETYSAKRYARQFELDSQDLLDGDVDLLVAYGRLVGEAAAGIKSDLVYLTLLANDALSDGVALFHASHANLDTGAALDATNLDAAMAAVKLQQESGRPLGLPPTHLIVAPEKEGLARRLVRDMSEPLTVVGEPRLSIGVTDPQTGTSYSGSATSWYLAAASGPTVEVGYVGSPTPRIRNWDLTMGKWGKGFDVSYDIGSKALDYRGLHKATA